MFGEKKVFMGGSVELVHAEEPMEIKEARIEIARIQKHGGTMRELKIVSEKIRKYGYRLVMTM
jgi:predicted Zn-ribbon and HTH transcriptional regulator